jgi:hypothetical protein
MVVAILYGMCNKMRNFVSMPTQWPVIKGFQALAGVVAPKQRTFPPRTGEIRHADRPDFFIFASMSGSIVRSRPHWAIRTSSSAE